MLLSLKNKQEKRREEMCVSQKIKLIFGKIMGRVGVFRENKVIKLMSTC